MLGIPNLLLMKIIMQKKHLYIAAGIIRDPQNNIFIAQRPMGSHMGGFWEFPGGKLESNERPEDALVRELEEEIGIIATEYQLFKKVEHEFDDRFITLYFFLVTNWDNQPYGREGQNSRWVKQSDLIADQFPPANRIVVDILTQ